jgi:hypothetical protein
VAACLSDPENEKNLVKSEEIQESKFHLEIAEKSANSRVATSFLLMRKLVSRR